MLVSPLPATGWGLFADVLPAFRAAARASIAQSESVCYWNDDRVIIIIRSRQSHFCSEKPTAIENVRSELLPSGS
jgi:hypothetical protein